MSEPLNTPPGQWFGVLFLSLALLWPRAPLSFVLISYVVYPTVAVAEQMVAGRDFLGSQVKVLSGFLGLQMVSEPKALGG